MYKALLLKNRQPRPGQWLALALLVLTLLLLGLESSFLFRGLSQGWLWLSTLAGLPERLRELSTHSLPFRLLCVALCITLVHVCFRNWQKTLLVLCLYGGAFLLSVLLVWMGKGQQESIASGIGKELLGTLVSPFLVVVLIPTLQFLNAAEASKI